MEASMFEVGQTVENQYLVLERYRGRRWTLYTVLDRISENVFTVKRPSESLRSDAFSAALFRERAKTWINVGECDEIAKAYLIKDFDGIPHLFVEYIDGPTLADVLNLSPGKPLPVNQIIGLMKELANGMRFLHTARLPGESIGVIHGVLTPRNILTIAGNIKITDVGLSISMQQRADASAGSLPDRIHYMAPEQIEDPQRADRLTDIYSFGAVMYEAATGAPPTINVRRGDPLIEAVRLDPVSPSLRNRSCPQWLEETILKCMARKPENRFQSIDQIISLVNDLAGNEGIPQVSPDDKGESEEASRVARVRGVAKKESRRLDHYYLGVEHVMIGLLNEEESVVVSCLGDMVTADQVLEKMLSRLPKGEGPWYWDGIRKTPRYERVMKLARKIRRAYSPSDRMLPQHLLLAILEEGRSIPVRVLRELGVDVGTVAENLKREIMRRRPAIVVPDSGIPGARFAGVVPCTTDVPYCVPFVGRRSELERTRDLLLNDRKGVLLVGDAGVGKTALVHELACVASDGAPALEPGLTGIFQLRLAALLAGSADGEQALSYLGEMLDGIVGAHAILLIEDIPTLLGLDIKMPARGAAEILGDYILSKGLLVVASALPSGYAFCESNYPELVARLEIVNLREPSFEEMLEMLAAAKRRFELEHSVNISDDALAAVLRASEIFVSGSALPGKAFELLDRICAARACTRASGGALEQETITAACVEGAFSDGDKQASQNEDWVLNT